MQVVSNGCFSNDMAVKEAIGETLSKFLFRVDDHMGAHQLQNALVHLIIGP